MKDKRLTTADKRAIINKFSSGMAGVFILSLILR
jgi:hypothetical protein